MAVLSQTQNVQMPSPGAEDGLSLGSPIFDSASFLGVCVSGEVEGEGNSNCNLLLPEYEPVSFYIPSLKKLFGV